VKICALLALAGLACVTRTGPGKTIKHVDIRGNLTFSDKSIINKIATRPPRGLLTRVHTAFDRVTLELDRNRVTAFYREHGFFAARVTDIDVHYGPKTVDVVIEVVEGEPTYVASVDVEAPGIDGMRLRPLIPVEKGERFHHPDYLIAKDEIKKYLVKEGYAHATVDGVIEVDRDARTARVKLTVDPGPLVHFGEVRVEGLTRVPESAVRNRVAWVRGQVFDPMEIEETQASLYALGLFSVVRVNYETAGRPAVSDVTISLTEGTRHELRLGGGVGVDRAHTEIHLRGQYTVRGFFDPLTTLRLDARPGYSVLGSTTQSGITGEASVALEKEDFLFARLKGQSLLAYDIEPREGYSIRGPRTMLALGRKFFDNDLLLSVAWHLRLLSFVDLDPALFGDNADEAWLGYYEQQIALDFRDHPLDPTRGLYAELRLEEGGPFAAGAQSFFRATPELRGYVPLGKRLVLAARLRGGKLTSWSGDAGPITQRYYEGGAAGHRGFGYRRLSPMVADEEGRLIPVGGDEMALATAEARLELFRIGERWFSIATFMDAGDVARAGELSLGNPHLAAGLGVRYDTLIGPVRLDFAYRLNRAGEGEPDPGQRLNFHFSLGEAF
jgi:translocation and assembly module TamA